MGLLAVRRGPHRLHHDESVVGAPRLALRGFSSSGAFTLLPSRDHLSAISIATSEKLVRASFPSPPLAPLNFRPPSSPKTRAVRSPSSPPRLFERRRHGRLFATCVQDDDPGRLCRT